MNSESSEYSTSSEASDGAVYHEVKVDKQRLLILVLMVEMMHCVTEACLNTKHFSSKNDVLLFVAIAIGELEGRPMSASKISQFIRMPRPSAMRKLSELQRAGMIDRPTKRAYVLAGAGPRHVDMAHAVTKLAKKIRKVSTELSKLDS